MPSNTSRLTLEGRLYYMSTKVKTRGGVSAHGALWCRPMVPYGVGPWCLWCRPIVSYGGVVGVQCNHQEQY